MLNQTYGRQKELELMVEDIRVLILGAKGEAFQCKTVELDAARRTAYWEACVRAYEFRLREHEAELAALLEPK